MASPAPVPPTAGAPAQWEYKTQGSQFSNVHPVWQFVLLSVLTFGGYFIVWFYRNWSLLRERRGLHITPAARAFFSPFFGVAFYKELAGLVGHTGYAFKTPPESLGSFYICCMVISRIIDRITQRQSNLALEVVSIVIFLGAVASLTPAVKALNAFWRHEQPGYPERRRLSGGAWLVAILGGLLWVSFIFAILSPEEASSGLYSGE